MACLNVYWMTLDQHYPGEPLLPDLGMIGRIESKIERNGKTKCEIRYDLCSLALRALNFVLTVRADLG